MNKVGFKCAVRLNKQDNWCLYVLSKNDIVNTYFKDGKKKYVALEHFRNFRSGSYEMSTGWFPREKIKQFEFSMESLPKFVNPEIIKKEIIFNVNGRFDTLNITINKTNVDALSDMPQFWTQEYFKMSPSGECSTSLLSFFRERTKGMSDSSVVRYLLSFVRMGFKFEDDAVSFGYQKPMVVEEVLYYPTADCEDKSALFFYLVKELLNVDVLVLKYPKHVNVAVLLDKPYGKPFVYKGKEYSVCETNLLGDSERAGIGYNTETSPPKVVYEYHPFMK
jgi:hypothetical protein